MAKFFKFVLCINPSKEERGTSAMKFYRTFDEMEIRFEKKKKPSFKSRGWHSGWWESKWRGRKTQEVQPIWTTLSGDNLSPKEYFDLLDNMAPQQPPACGISLQEVVIATVPTDTDVETLEVSKSDIPIPLSKETLTESYPSTNSSGKGLAALAGRLARFYGVRKFVRRLSKDRMFCGRTFSARLASRSSKRSNSQNQFVTVEKQVFMVTNTRYTESSSWTESNNISTPECTCLLSCQLGKDGKMSGQVVSGNTSNHDPSCVCHETSVTWLISIDPLKTSVTKQNGDLFSESSMYAWPFGNTVALDRLSSTTSGSPEIYNNYILLKEDSNERNTFASASNLTQNLYDSKMATNSSRFSARIADLSGFVNTSKRVINSQGLPACKIASASRIRGLSTFKSDKWPVVCDKTLCVSNTSPSQIEDENKLMKIPPESEVDFPKCEILKNNICCLPLCKGEENEKERSLSETVDTNQDSDLVYLTLLIQGKVVSVYRTDMDNIMGTKEVFSENISDSLTEKSDGFGEILSKEVSCQTGGHELNSNLTQKSFIEGHINPCCSEKVDRSVSAMGSDSKTFESDLSGSYKREEANPKMDEILNMLGVLENLLQSVIIPSVNQKKERSSELVDEPKVPHNKIITKDIDLTTTQIGKRECEKIAHWVRDDILADSDLFPSEVVQVTDCAAPYSDKFLVFGTSSYLKRSLSLEDLCSQFGELKKSCGSVYPYEVNGQIEELDSNCDQEEKRCENSSVNCKETARGYISIVNPFNGRKEPFVREVALPSVEKLFCEIVETDSSNCQSKADTSLCHTLSSIIEEPGNFTRIRAELSPKAPVTVRLGRRPHLNRIPLIRGPPKTATPRFQMPPSKMRTWWREKHMQS